MAREPIIVFCNDKPFPGIAGHFSECQKCIVKIFISDSTVRSIESQGYKQSDCEFLCFGCSKPFLAEMSPSNTLPITKEQAGEVLKNIVRMK